MTRSGYTPYPDRLGPDPRDRVRKCSRSDSLDLRIANDGLLFALPPDMAPTLRPYQLDQCSNVEALLYGVEGVDPIRSALVVAATGTGKTLSVAELAHRAVERGLTVLFLAHRWELLKQARTAFQARDLDVGLERGRHHAGPESVVVASVQTMRGERLAKFPHDAFDVILVDEAHHAAAGSYLSIFKHFSTAKVVGFTATADRADGIPLATVFEKVAHRIEIDEAVASGYLTPVRCVEVTVTGLDLSKVRQRRQKKVDIGLPGEAQDLLAPSCPQARVAVGGRRCAVDLHPKDLGLAVTQPLAVDGVVVPLLALTARDDSYAKTIIFAVDRRHGEALCEAINRRAPGQARFVHHESDDRDEIQADHKAGLYSFLINVMLLTEGYDDPSIEVVAMARPTMSRVLYSQCVGRALRLFAGKTLATLIDFVGVGSQFDLVGPEDVLGTALVETISYAPADRPIELEDAARRAALGLGPVARPPLSAETAPLAPVPAPIVTPATETIEVDVKVTFTTRVVDLFKRVGRWMRRG